VPLHDCETDLDRRSPESYQISGTHGAFREASRAWCGVEAQTAVESTTASGISLGRIGLPGVEIGTLGKADVNVVRADT
jgi:hypothetical protein